MSINLLHHNIQPYADLVAMLSASHKAMVVAATGAGKTSVALKYLEDHNLNALVVCPKRSICRQWEDASDRVEAITYQKFCNLSDFGNYGCYIFDEAHHVGAPKWGGQHSCGMLIYSNDSSFLASIRFAPKGFLYDEKCGIIPFGGGNA